MRPSNKTWSLTVRGRSLHLDAPHGSFQVRGIAPEVMPAVDALPDGTDVECEGAFDGGGTITHLVVTKIRRILKDLSGRVMTLPDAIVASDGRLAAARARNHLAAGNLAAAAVDVGSLLRLGDDQAIAELDHLPTEYQLPLLDALVEWQAARPAQWRALRHIPLERWTDDHIDRAVEQGLANGGVFGAAPGIQVETLLAELARRKRPTKSLTKQTQRLRRAQATEGDTYHRLTADIDAPRVVGADLQGVYVAGTASFGESVVQQGAQRHHVEDRRPVLVHYALDGRELARWVGITADRVVEGVALQLEAEEPAGVRIADGKQLYSFAYRIEHHDGELLWGIHAANPDKKLMRSEIRHIATGYTIAKLDTWVDTVEWNAKEIFIYGASPQTLTREGKLVRREAPPLPTSIEIETADDRHTIPIAHAPWQFGAWRSHDAGGWIVHVQGTELYLAPSEPGATWVHLELADTPVHVDVAPPWLAFTSGDGPIVLVALAEAMSAQEIRIDGKRFAKRAKTPPTLAVPKEQIELYTTLVDAAILPEIPAADRDAHLFRVFEGAKKLPDDALARVLVNHSPYCIDHADYYVDADDNLFERVTRALGDIAVRETSRVEREIDVPDWATDEEEAAAEDAEVTLTIEVTRDGKTRKRKTRWGIVAVMTAIDALLVQLGSPRRIYALASRDYNRLYYLVITPEQRRAIVAAGITGIRADAR